MIDLDALDAYANRESGMGIIGDELAALVRITRAAVAWRDCKTHVQEIDCVKALDDALRDAGL